MNEAHSGACRQEFDRPGSTATSLLDGVRDHLGASWQRLVHLYAPLIYCRARRLGLGPEEAADVVQEVFLIVATKFSSFRREHPGATFRGWLWRLAERKAIDVLRQRRGEPRAVGGDHVFQQLLTIPAEESSDGAAPQEFGALFRSALVPIQGEFEPSSWTAFWATTVDGRPARDVAHELGISPGAVYTAKSRVLRRLREALGDRPLPRNGANRDARRPGR